MAAVLTGSPTREILFDRRFSVDFVGINRGNGGETPVRLIELDGLNARRNRYGTCKAPLSMASSSLERWALRAGRLDLLQSLRGNNIH